MQNPYQLTQLSYDAGFRASRNELITAVAAAIGESGGNERARGDGGDSWGLWQINLPSHPEYKENPEQLYNPRTNADAAYKIYVEAGRSFEPFHAWSHAGGAKKAFLTSAALIGVSAWEVAHPAAALGTVVRPVGEAGKEAVTGAVTGALPGLEGVSDSLGRVGRWLTTPANIGRVAIAVIGAAIIIVGLAVLAKPVAESALDTVAKAKPI
jgi:Lysozyme like domain